MDTIARQVCLNAGGDNFTQGADAENILKVLRSYLQPDALGRMRQRATKSSQNKRADQPTERYLLEYDVLRRKAEARAIAGRESPDACASALFSRNAALSKNDKSLLLAIVRGS